MNLPRDCGAAGHLASSDGTASDSNTLEGCVDDCLDGHVQESEFDATVPGAWVEHAASLLGRGRYSEALACLATAVKLFPGIATIWAARGHAFQVVGESQAAVESYDEALSLDGSNAGCWHARGHALEAIARYREAAESFDNAIREERSGAANWICRGHALEQCGDIDAALESYSVAVSLDANDVHAWKKKGAAHYRSRQFTKAVESYERASVIAADDPELWASLSDAYEALDQLRDAVESCRMAIVVERRPDLVRALQQREVRLLSRLGRTEEALIAARILLEKDAEDPVNWELVGEILRELGRSEESLYCYDEALKINPRQYWTWLGRGHLLEMVERPELALEAYEAAIALDPDRPVPWMYRAQLLRSLGRLEDAVSSYKRALEIDEGQTWIWASLGAVLADLNRHDEAVAAFDNAPSSGSEGLALLQVKASSLFELGRQNDELLTHLQMLEIEPNREVSLMRAGILYRKLGLPESALPLFDSLIDSESDSRCGDYSTLALAWMNRAAALGDLELNSDAVESFATAVSIDPVSENIRGAMAFFLLGLERFDHALTVLDAGLRIDPTSKLYHRGRTSALLGLGRFDAALDSADLRLLLCPADSEAQFARACALANLSRHEESLAQLDAVEPALRDDEYLHIYARNLLALDCHAEASPMLFRLATRVTTAAQAVELAEIFCGVVYAPLMVEQLVHRTEAADLVASSLLGFQHALDDAAALNALTAAVEFNPGETGGTVSFPETCAVIRLLGGDPATALEAFLSIDPGDRALRLLYYRGLSATMCLDDRAESLWMTAEQRASDVCANLHSSDEQDCYYAGAVFCERRSWDAAIACLRASSCLAAAYLLAFALSHSDRSEELSDAVLGVLRRERKLLESGEEYGFLGRLGREDVMSNVARFPWWAAQSVEVSGGVHAIYACLDGWEIAGVLPPEASLLDTTREDLRARTRVYGVLARAARGFPGLTARAEAHLRVALERRLDRVDLEALEACALDDEVVRLAEPWLRREAKYETSTCIDVLRYAHVSGRLSRPRFILLSYYVYAIRAKNRSGGHATLLICAKSAAQGLGVLFSAEALGSVSLAACVAVAMSVAIESLSMKWATGSGAADCESFASFEGDYVERLVRLRDQIGEGLFAQIVPQCEELGPDRT